MLPVLWMQTSGIHSMGQTSHRNWQKCATEDLALAEHLPRTLDYGSEPTKQTPVCKKPGF